MNSKTSITLIGSILFFFLSFCLSAFQSQKENEFSNHTNIQKDTLKARKLLQKEKKLTSEGEYKAALDVVEQAQILYTKHQLWEQAILCVIQLSILADNFDTPELKVKYGNLGIILAQKYLTKENPLLASTFRQKAEAMMMIQSLDSANYYLTKAIPIFKKQKDWTNLGWSEILIGYNYFNKYQLDSCQLHYQNVEQLLQKEVLPKIEQIDIRTTLLSLRGLLYEQQGDYDKAIQNTKQALNLDIQKGTYTKQDSSFISIHFNNLGAFYTNKGDYQRALDNFMQAIHMDETLSLNSITFLNIGEALYEQKKYTESIAQYKKSLILNSQSETELKTQMEGFQGIGNGFQALGLIDSALHYYLQATQLPTSYRKPIAWIMMGSLYKKKQEFQKALKYLHIAEKTYLEDSIASQHGSFVIANVYYLMGDVHFLNQDPNTALTFYQKALIANHSIFQDSLHIEANPPLIGIYDPNYFLTAIQGKAQTLASFPDSSKNLGISLATYQVLIQWTDSLQSIHATEAASLDWSEKFKQIYEEAIAVAFRLYQQTQQSDYLELAFSFSEKSKNSLLLESLKATEGKTIAGVPDSLLQKEKDLNIDIAFYEKVLQKAQDDQEEAKTKLYQNYLSKTRLELVELREALERDFPKFHTLKYGGETTSIATIQSQLLDKQSVFVEYFVGDSSTFVFVISANSTHFLQLDVPDEIRKPVLDFQKTLLDPNSFKQNAKQSFTTYHQKATKVYQDILQPVLATLSDDIQQLRIVPDDFLNSLPFEALTKPSELKAGFDFAKLPYLLYDFEVNYAYSADLLLQNQAKQKQLSSNADCLAFAPSYQKGQIASTQRGSLQQLRNTTGNLEGTAREIQAIAHFFDGQFDFGKTATERQFKQFAPQFGILHLAMHGVPDLENANFNHLQFSNLERDTLEDNLLHHYEIANMDLEAQLVVLSACETGVGKYEKGEGVYSLARSFMYAGVPSVVMSLWKVSDASTSELMPYLYENLSGGQSKEMALQGAKLRFLEEANLEYRHPFYWSAFVLMGDAGKIRQGHKWFWYLGIGVLIFGGLGVWLWRRK